MAMRFERRLAALLPVLIAGAPCLAQAPVAEYPAKVVLLEKLTRFVEWPQGEHPRSPFILAVVGRTPFGDGLEDHFATHPIKNLPVSVRYFSDPAQISPCDLLFIPRSETANLAAILSRVKAQPILTVADSEGFTQRGVMVNLVREGSRITFEVNLAAVRESKLRMHPGFLQLARITVNN